MAEINLLDDDSVILERLKEEERREWLYAWSMTGVVLVILSLLYFYTPIL